MAPLTFKNTTVAVASKVAVPVDGNAHQYSAILLRDLCECQACIHEFTRQKLYSVTDVPPNIQARSVISSESTSDAIDILWDDDVPGFDPQHTTTISTDVLRDIDSLGAAKTTFHVPTSRPRLWDSASFALPDIEYESYMHDDATLYQAIEQLQTHGLLFVTDVPGVEKSVSAIAERIGPLKDTFYGNTWDVRNVPKAINVAYTSSDLGFHADLLYFQNPAHIQLLHCIQSSSSGGASVFVDAFRAAQDLYETDMDAFNVLSKLSVNYHYKHPNSNLYSATKPVFEMRPLRIADTTYATLSEFLEGWEHSRTKVKQSSGTELPPLSVFDCLEKVNWGPPFLAPFSLEQESMEQARSSVTARESLNEKMCQWHAAATKFSTVLHRHEILHERLMKPGECVLFNNTRVLHSRRTFDSGDVGKARWLKGAYVDKDPFFSKLRVLRDRFMDQ